MIEVNDQVLAEVNKSFVIPPQPQLLVELQALLEQEEPYLSDAADIIAKDVAIASAILKIINSPAYGLSRTVSDIKQAVMFLGWDGIKAIVPSLKLKEAFATQKSCISLERFWDTANEIAEVSMYIGKLVKSKVPVENLYTLGLFHDCGVPPMAIKFADYVDTLKTANEDFDTGITELEEKRYQTNHAVIGYYLASSWHLPKDICQIVLRHHELSYLDTCDDPINQISFAVLKMAENIVHYERRYSNLRDWVLLKNDILDVLGMSEEDYQDLKDDISDSLLAA